MNIHGYDEWKLRGPDEGRCEPGTESGQDCNRLPEPDEDAPRNWRPRPCAGTMIEQGGSVVCDKCGEVAE